MLKKHSKTYICIEVSLLWKIALLGNACPIWQKCVLGSHPWVQIGPMRWLTWQSQCTSPWSSMNFPPICWIHKCTWWYPLWLSIQTSVFVLNAFWKVGFFPRIKTRPRNPRKQRTLERNTISKKSFPFYAYRAEDGIKWHSYLILEYCVIYHIPW